MSDDEDDVDKDLLSIDESLKNTEEYQELVLLLKMQKMQEKKKREKVIENKEELIVHEGYKVRSLLMFILMKKCDSCGVEPIVGERWKCMSCPDDMTVDLCKECKEAGDFETLTHSRDHSMQKITSAERMPYHLDYHHADTNYLDPKFVPNDEM